MRVVRDICANHVSIEISALDVGDAEDGPRRPQPPFGNYNEEPPPAPHIHSKGIVATDITVHFIKAAEGMSLPAQRAMRDRADLQQNSMLASSSKMTFSHSLSP